MTLYCRSWRGLLITTSALKGVRIWFLRSLNTFASSVWIDFRCDRNCQLTLLFALIFALFLFVFLFWRLIFRILKQIWVRGRRRVLRNLLRLGSFVWKLCTYFIIWVRLGASLPLTPWLSLLVLLECFLDHFPIWLEIFWVQISLEKLLVGVKLFKVWFERDQFHVVIGQFYRNTLKDAHITCSSCTICSTVPLISTT